MSSANAQRGRTFAFKLISFNHKECPILAKGRGILEFEKCVFADGGNSFAQAALFSKKPLMLRFRCEAPHLDKLYQAVTLDAITHLHLAKVTLGGNEEKDLLRVCTAAGRQGWKVRLDPGSSLSTELLQKTLFLADHDALDGSGQSLFTACNQACLRAAAVAAEEIADRDGILVVILFV